MRTLLASGHQIAPRILGELGGQIFERDGDAHAARLLCRDQSVRRTTVHDFGMVSSGYGFDRCATLRVHLEVQVVVAGPGIAGVADVADQLAHGSRRRPSCQAGSERRQVGKK